MSPDKMMMINEINLTLNLIGKAKKKFISILRFDLTGKTIFHFDQLTLQ